MGALSIPLADPGPLQMMATAIEARVQEIFPPNSFSFAFIPARADRAWFKRYVPRCPAVALGWNGVQAVSEDGGVFTGTAHWTLALIVKNSANPRARYMGDALGPGLFAMQRAATVLLHGWLIDPPDTPWCATGTLAVTAVGNLYNEEWGDEDTAIAALDLRVLYEEALPPGLEQDPGAGPVQLGVTWDFGQVDSLTDTIGGAPGG